ncbi:hypothetical protein JCM18899A_43300 [Nocardioides sp. AN3]
MMHEDSDWFSLQASASARRLAETPASLLGPAGRSLRQIASQWPTPSVGVVALAAAPSRERREQIRETSIQLPLLGSVE